jgi:hypothetical protein
MNAPIYYLKKNSYDFQGVLRWCNEAGEFRANCYYGVGAQAARRNIENQAFLKGLCLQIDSRYQVDCIGGALSTYVEYFVSLDRAYNFCTLFEERNRTRCTEKVGLLFPLQ